MSAQTVSNLANKFGWARQRREAEAKVLAQAEDQTREAIAEALESVATRTEELVERGLDLAEEAADERDAKGFAMAAKGVQSLHAVYRLARGLDGGSSSGGGGPAVNLVFARFSEAGDAPKTEQRAEPVEVSAHVVGNSDDITLDFESSQQDGDASAGSASLIDDCAQVVGNRTANTR